MAYAAVTDIQEEFKSAVFNSTSAVKDTQVTRFISEAEAEINGRVGLVYQVPIDSTASPISFVLMRRLSIQMVSERLQKILEVKTSEDKTSQVARGKNDKNAYDVLDDIVNQKLKLIDAFKVSVKDGVRSFANDNSEPLVFDKDTVQW